MVLNRDTSTCILCLLFLFSYALSFEHECIHDSLNLPPPTRVPQDPPSKEFEISLKRSIEQAGTLYTQPLRIKLDFANLQGDPNTCYKVGDVVTSFSGASVTCTADDILTATKEEHMREIITDSVAFWSETIAVVPTDAINLASTCFGLSVTSDKVRGVDFYLFVSTRPIPGTTIASGGTCFSSDTTGRPVSGIINLNPRRLRVDEIVHRAEEVAVVIHEIAHALGFSYSQFTNWIKYTGNSPNSFVQLQDYQIRDSNAGINYIISPRVVKAAQEHFGCNSTYVAPLEPFGREGTRNSHWAMRQFFNDFMVGVSTAFPLYSQMTFALLEDTGWYQVYNTEKIETLVWGRKRGCSFISSCDNWPTHTSQDPGYKCQYKGDIEECTADLRSEGHCTEGISSTLMGRCAYIGPVDARRCDNPENKFIKGINVGDSIGRTSRCFKSNLLKLFDQFDGAGSAGHLTQCYKTTCESRTKLKVGVENVWYDCPYEGGEVKPIGFGGTIRCIPGAADRICLDAKEDPDWPKIYSVSPRSVPPGGTITINGTNFLKTESMSAVIVSTCSNLEVISDSEMRCQIGPVSDYSNIRGVAYSLTGLIPVHLIITDAQGRTDSSRHAFSVEMNYDTTMMEFIQVHPIWFTLICTVLLVIFTFAACLILRAKKII